MLMVRGKGMYLLKTLQTTPLQDFRQMESEVSTNTTTEPKPQFLIEQIKMMYLTLGFLLAKNFKPDVQILYTIIQ